MRYYGLCMVAVGLTIARRLSVATGLSVRVGRMIFVREMIFFTLSIRVGLSIRDELRMIVREGGRVDDHQRSFMGDIHRSNMMVEFHGSKIRG